MLIDAKTHGSFTYRFGVIKDQLPIMLRTSALLPVRTASPEQFSPQVYHVKGAYCSGFFCKATNISHAGVRFVL